MAKVLLVEDDNNLREIYEARLQAEGYQIATARDGEEALVVAKQEHPDLVISDVMMPKISGFEMLDILRNTDGMQAVKVIMLTALGQNDDQQRATQLGADRYLVKSQVTLEDIVRAAHELLEDAPAAVTPAAPAAHEPLPAPAPTTSPDDDPTSSVTPVNPVEAEAAEATADAEPSAQETANVDSKIEDFVSGASSDAPAPEAADAPAPEPTTEPEPAAPAATAASTSDDKLLTDAVNNLVKNTEESAPEPATDPTTAPPLPSDAVAAAPPTVGGTKVIQPMDAPEPKTDLNTLVANEGAQQAASAPTPPAADPTDPNDPRNLAL